MKRGQRIAAFFLAAILLAVTLSSCFTDSTQGELTDVNASTYPNEPYDTVYVGTDETSGGEDTLIPVDPIVPDTQTPDTTPVTPTPETVPGEVVFVSSSGYSDYRVIYPSGASAQIKYAAQELADYLNKTFPGASVKVIPDTGAASASENEILVGNVVRNEVPSADSSKSDYTVRIVGKRAVLTGKDETGIVNAINYFKYHFASGKRASAPENFSYTCESAPRVTSQAPEKYYYYEDVYTPNLVFSFVGTPAVDTSKTKLVINNIDVSSYATWGNGIVTLSNQKFAAGSYNVWLVITDTDGDVLVHSSVFSCGDGSVMNLYSGELHAHTSESDGQGTVEQAYIYARDTAKLDFFSITDHSNSINVNTYRTKHIAIADSLNDPGRFVTLYGYEQTYNFASGYFGHLNVINFSTITQRSMALDTFYETMSKKDDVVVMFNHPGYKWGNFLEYSLYSEKVDSVLNLAEIKGSAYDTEYSLALTNGWHVSPMYNEDNHQANWGAANEACGFALAPALTRQNILEAFAKNRTYTTLDSTLRVYYQINGEWMGSRLNNPEKLNVRVELSTRKATGLGLIQLVAEDNIVAAQVNAGTAKNYVWEFEIDPLFDYYYVRLEGSSVWCITAPIWIENREELTIESLDFEVLTNNAGTDDYLVQATVKNNSKSPMTDVTASFYLISGTGTTTLNYKSAKPYVTVSYGTLDAGASAVIEGAVKYVLTTPRVVVIVTGKINGKEFLATSFMRLSNIYITEIMAYTTSDGGIDNPYDYFELYNNSDTPINLSNYSLRYYPKAGASDSELAANTWKLTGTIQPFSTMVVWVKSAVTNVKTVDDFNKRFNTNLVLNKDIVIISGIDIPSTNAVQIELLSGSTVVTRTWYNWGNKTSVSAYKGVDFAYPLKYTETAREIGAMVSPTPGRVTSVQVPKAVTR